MVGAVPPLWKSLWQGCFGPKRGLGDIVPPLIGLLQRQFGDQIISAPVWTACTARKWVFNNFRKTTFEEDLHQAINQDEQALVHIINELHQLILTASGKYRECLTKQIGALRKENSDQVTEWRVLANELAGELDEYWVLLRVLSEIVEEEENSVARVFKRVKVVALEEFEANKRKELELLQAQYEHILESDLN